MTPATAAANLPENVTTFEDASNSRWLAVKLAAARASVKAAPTEDAVERIRARVFGEGAARKKQRSIAA